MSSLAAADSLGLLRKQIINIFVLSAATVMNWVSNVCVRHKKRRDNIRFWS